MLCIINQETKMQNTKVNENTDLNSSSQEEIILPVGNFTELEKPKFSFLREIEAFIGKLSTKNNFWNKVCSLI